MAKKQFIYRLKYLKKQWEAISLWKMTVYLSWPYLLIVFLAFSCILFTSSSSLWSNAQLSSSRSLVIALLTNEVIIKNIINTQKDKETWLPIVIFCYDCKQ